MDGIGAPLTNISAPLDFGVDRKTFRPWFSFAALTELLTVQVNGLVYMNFSRAWEDRLSDGSNVADVRCEYRHPSVDELEEYAWQINSFTDLPRLTIISIDGDLCITIICESYEVAREPLSRKFPGMV
jgi:hypothetical protein